MKCELKCHVSGSITRFQFDVLQYPMTPCNENVCCKDGVCSPKLQVELKAQIIDGKAESTSPMDVWLGANDGLIHMSPGFLSGHLSNVSRCTLITVKPFSLSVNCRLTQPRRFQDLDKGERNLTSCKRNPQEISGKSKFQLRTSLHGGPWSP